MTTQWLSEKQLRLAGKWTPNEPFADLRAMMLTIPLTEGIFEAAMTTRAGRTGSHAIGAILLPRLPFKVVYIAARPTPVIPYHGGAQWVRQVSQHLPGNFEFDLMRSACWRLSCRVSRGSRERTQLAKLAFKQFVELWPHDARAKRQPFAASATAAAT